MPELSPVNSKLNDLNLKGVNLTYVKTDSVRQNHRRTSFREVHLHTLMVSIRRVQLTTFPPHCTFFSSS